MIARRLLHLLCLLALVLRFPFAIAGEVELAAPEDLMQLLQPALPAADVSEAGTRLQVRRKLESSLPALLATEGYFSPELDFIESDAGLSVRVEPGPRTKIVAVDIVIAGKLTEQRRAALVAGWKLPVGSPFRQADWSEAKAAVLAELLAVEYPSARLAESRAEIDPASQQARLRVSYEAGPAYRFGEFRIDGLQRYDAKMLAGYSQAVRLGDTYREDLLVQLQGRLQASPYFVSAQVDIDPDAEPDADGVVVAPVHLRLRERQPHRLAFGAGASTNTGARVEANYHTADFLRRALEMDSGIRLEQKKQSAYADIFLPPDVQRYRYGFGALLEKSDIESLKTERFSLGAQRIQVRDGVETRLRLNWQEETKNPDGAASTSDGALVASGQWTWRNVDSVLDPRQGAVLQGNIGGAAKALLSDQDFIRLYAHGLVFLPLNMKNILVMRAEIGATLAASRSGIPQDYLFRAGGSNSIRGYDYQSLGVREGNAVVGGRYLYTASAEWVHWLDDKWGVATFVDVGDAVDDLAGISPAVGYGVGGRLKSLLGPLAVDLAYGDRTNALKLHFSLAIPF